MLAAVVIVPELGRYEEVFALHKTVLDGALDALAGLLLILIIIGSVEASVTCLDGLCE